MKVDNWKLRALLCTAVFATAAACGDDDEDSAISGAEPDGGTVDNDATGSGVDRDASTANASGTGRGSGEHSGGTNESVPTLDVPLENEGRDAAADAASPDSGLVDVESSRSDDSSTHVESGSSAVDTARSSASGDPTTTTSVSSEVTVDTEETTEPSDERMGCAGDLTPTLNVSGNVTGTVEWSGVVRITDDMVLQSNAELTIAAGTRIVVGPDVYVDFGNVAGDPTVFANGTQEEPIVFCGTEHSPGFWRGLRIGGGVTTNSEFHYLKVFDAGSTTPAVDVAAAVLIDHLDVRGSSNIGVRAAAFGAGSTALSVYDSASAATLTEPAAVTHFPLGGEFVGNTENLVQLTFTRVEEPTTYQDLGIPYLQMSNTEVMAQATVVFEAGVDYHFAADVDFTVGAFANVATWEVNGTEEAPVVFQGASPTPGYWGGIVVGANVTSASNIQYLDVRYGGGTDSYALDVQAPITVTHLNLDANEGGARIGETGLSEDSSAWTIINTENEPLTVHPNALTRIPSGTYIGNDSDRIIISSGINSSEGTVRDHGLPYFVEAAWETRTGSDLTFEPNTEFLMGPDTRITFSAFGQATAVTFAGNEGAPVRFRAAQDGFTGYWAGLLIGAAVQTGSLMNWTEIADAGGPEDNAAALRIDKAVFPVNNSSFTNFDNYGIYVNEDSNVTDYEATVLNNTFAGANGFLANVGRN